MKTFFLLLIFTLASFKIFACTCTGPEKEFCAYATDSSYIVLVELLAFEDFSAGYFKVIENITDQETPDTLNIVGADGWLCGVPLEQFAVGDTLILNVGHYPDDPYQNVSNGKYYTWYLWVCSRNYLYYDSGYVSGPLTSFDYDTLPYEDFKAFLPDCYDFVTYTDEMEEEQVNIFPNPFQDVINIEVESSTISNIKILDTQGNIVQEETRFKAREGSINVESLPSGIFFIVIRIDEKIIQKKILKI